jgi:indolepyruvate ferredoxin oxidoreductase alpha subunit
VSGALVIVTADDPGMASSQNEQDNRHYAVAAALPMLEPSDSQEAYDFTQEANSISERWGIPVQLRVTTRVCHSKSVVRARGEFPPGAEPEFRRDIRGRVMIPAYARPAHRRLRAKLAEIAEWAETSALNRTVEGGNGRAIITSGVTHAHVREAAPDATVLKLGITYPLPLGLIRGFVERCGGATVVEEGDPVLTDRLRAAGIAVDAKHEGFRFGELNVAKVRMILAGEEPPEAKPVPGKPPELCKACPYRPVNSAIRKLDCIVAGDIGCYTLGVLEPFEAMDTCVCMGASIGVGLGLRHGLPPAQAKRVVSVIGDSTFMHSGLVGIAEMVYNPPPTGHVVLILDNATTAMTGQQEHPGTGRKLDHQQTNRVVIEDVIRALGVDTVHEIDPVTDAAGFEALLRDSLEGGRLVVIVARRTCILAAGKIREMEKTAERCGAAAAEEQVR